MCRTCADRQEGTESDGYTEEEKLRLAQAWLAKGRRSSTVEQGDEDEKGSGVFEHTTMR